MRVRTVLGEQIELLRRGQDDLLARQDETHSQVLGIKDDIGDVRLHVDDIAAAISRCEGSLGDAAGRQTYMSRGVRLLVQCVGDLLRHNNPAVADELDQFSRLSAEYDEEFHYRTSGGGAAGGGTPARGPRGLDCPGSPNLSEIGSVASTTVLSRHEQEQQVVAPLTLRPRRSSHASQAVTPPPVPRPPSRSSSAVGNDNDNAASGFTPGSVMGTMSALKAMSSPFGRSGSGVTASTTASTSGSVSSCRSGVMGGASGAPSSGPEDEVPNPSVAAGGELEELKNMSSDELLSFVRNGASPMRV